MHIKAAACALLVSLASSAALAQMPPPYGERGWGPAAGLPAGEVTAIVRSRGFIPMQPPVRIGATYLLRAADRYGRPVRVAVDARSGAILAVRPAGGPQQWAYGGYRGYGPYGPEPGYRPYGPYEPRAARGPMPADPYGGEAMQPPPGPGPNASPGAPAAQPAQPGQKSSAVTPANPPVPRPKPAKPAAVKPAETPAEVPPPAGEIATSRPVTLPPAASATKSDTGAQTNTAAFGATPGAPAFPPVAPLE